MKGPGNLSNKDQSEKRVTIKRIIKLIILLIILILLIHSCSSNFFGRIGNIFDGSSDYSVEEDQDKDYEKIHNKNIKFVKKTGTTTVDGIYKIQFTTEDINPDKITCTTSDADIATCIVRDNYVVVFPKKIGEVTISVIAKVNGYKYVGTHKLTIKEKKRSIALGSYSGTIYLNESSSIKVPYFLNSISGKVSSSSSNSDIATVACKNGLCTITGKKEGKVDITITITYKGTTYKATYSLTVKDKRSVTSKDNDKSKDDSKTKVKSSNANLKSLSVSKGSLKPKFDKDTLSYSVNVGSSTSKITVSSDKESAKAKVYYYVNDSRVSSLKNIKLNYGKNKIVISVVAENGKVKKYTVIVNREKKDSSSDDKPVLSNINTLDNITVSGYDIDFDSYVNSYNLTVSYDKEEVKITTKKTDSKSTVKYYVNDNEVSNLNNVSLDEGKNKIKIVVTSESGKDNTYNLVITRPIRKIEVSQDVKTLYTEDGAYNISYKILEDKNATGNFVEIDDYNVNDISYTIPSFSGNTSLYKGYISINPDNNDVNKSYELTLTYNKKSSTLNFKVSVREYYVKTIKDTYNFDYNSNDNISSILINTNLFNGDISYEDIEGGIKLSNSKGYITITSSDTDILEVSYDEDDNTEVSDYIAFRNKLKKEGTAYITIKGYVAGEEISSNILTVNITRKYSVIIDALDGFFNAFATKYEFLYEAGKEIDLSEYMAYKKDDTDQCKYYSLVSYNTKEDGTGTSYDLDDVIVVDKDITLYAMYSEESKIEDIKEENMMYLTEVDLFHNEEYYKKYNESKVIYPGAFGSHSMYIKNNTNSTIKINKFKLTEYTHCIENLGCIDQGYIIKYTKASDPWEYFYGGNNSYKVLNRDDNAVKSTDGSYINEITIQDNDKYIELAPGEEATIALLWKWVEVDDELDTAIGSIKDEQIYSIMVGIGYETESSVCNNN